MNKKFSTVLEKILPKLFFNALVSLNIRTKRIVSFYKFAFVQLKNRQSAMSILLFPMFGGKLLKSSNVSFPKKYWYTWVWMVDIINYGATLSWEGESVTATYENIKLSAPANDQSLQTVFFEMFKDDEYRLNDFSLDGLNVLDVGANIGDSPIMFMTKGARSVHAFEPLPALKKYLIQNIQQNNFSDTVTIHNVGLSNKDETIKIYMRQQGTAGSSMVLHSQEKMSIKPGYIEQNIKLVNAIDYLKKHEINNIDVVKMDCEHCEYIVFATSELLHYLNPKLIFLEYHDGFSSLQALFEENGYTVSVYKKNERVGILIATKNY